MAQNKKIRVGITHGDINGIGYEVIMKALEDPLMTDLCTPIVYGSSKALSYHRKALEMGNVNFTLVPRAEDAADGVNNLVEVVDYLRKTNNSYLRNQLPNIERHFAALISRSDSNNNLPLLFNFYREVKTEIERRIDSDNQWFDAIISAEQSNSEVSVAGNAVQAESDSIEDKLSDLINMFVIHLRGDYDRNLCHAVLFAVISLEKDICQNNRIRNRVLRPLVDALNSRNS